MLTNNIVSCISLLGVLGTLLAIILLINLVSVAFKESLVWGIICLLFPIGTIFFCKRHWYNVGNLAIGTTISISTGLLMVVLLNLVQ